MSRKNSMLQMFWTRYKKQSPHEVNYTTSAETSSHITAGGTALLIFIDDGNHERSSRMNLKMDKNILSDTLEKAPLRSLLTSEELDTRFNH